MYVKISQQWIWIYRDADFDGGYVCGPHKNSTCTYIIGVLGYASLSSITTVDFTLVATLSPQHKIFGKPQLNQRISPYGSKLCKLPRVLISPN